jgi:hypothetical protein
MSRAPTTSRTGASPYGIYASRSILCSGISSTSATREMSSPSSAAIVIGSAVPAAAPSTAAAAKYGMAANHCVLSAD